MRAPFRDEQEAAFAKVERLERENTELRAALEAARSTRPSALAHAILLGALLLSSLNVGLFMIPRAPASHPIPVELPPPTLWAAELNARPSDEAHWLMLTDHGRNVRAGARIGRTAYLVGDDGMLIRFGEASTEGEDCIPGAPTLLGIGGQPSAVYAVGAGGAIFVEKGDGHWQAEPSGTRDDLFGIAMLDSKSYAVGRHGTILVRRNGTWSREPAPTTRDLYAVASAGTKIYAVGAGGVVLVKQEEGAGWREEPSGVTSDLFALSAKDAMLYAVGAGGTILRRAPDGWVPEWSGTSLDLRAVTGDATSLVAVGEHGLILRSADRGGVGAWHPETSPGAASLSAVVAAGPYVYAAGDGRLLRRSTD